MPLRAHMGRCVRPRAVSAHSYMQMHARACVRACLRLHVCMRAYLCVMVSDVRMHVCGKEQPRSAWTTPTQHKPICTGWTHGPCHNLCERTVPQSRT